MKRAHTNANVAPCLVTLGAQVNAAFPKRDKRSDGIWPSEAHSKASPNSDHERGNAKDVDDDLLPGNESAYWDVWALVLSLVASRDPRISYIIHDDRIWTPSKGWQDYSGSNPHKTHAHISIKESLRNDKREWSITAPKPVSAPAKRYDVGYVWVDFDIAAVDKAALLAWCKANSLRLTGVRQGMPGRTIATIHAGEAKRGLVIAKLATLQAAQVISRHTSGGGTAAPDNTVRRLNPPTPTYL